MITSLTSLKIKWYGHSLLKTIYEYSIALFFFCAVFVFGVFNPLLISQPIAAILENNLPLMSSMIYLLALNIIFIILFFCQRKIIFNNEFERYVITLPISKIADRISSIFVLFVSNNFLWILLFMGSFVAFHDQQSKTVIIVETIYLVVGLLMAQLFLYEKNISKLICLVVGDIIFLVAKRYPQPEIIKIGIIFFLSVFILAIAFSNLKNISLEIKRYQFKKPRVLTGSVLPIQIAMLKPFFGFLIIKIIFTLSLESIAAVFILHIENRSLFYFIIFFNFLAICVLSSFSRVLAVETKKMSAYFQSLPISIFYWFFKNQTLNLILSISILTPVLCFALWRSVFSLGMVLYLILVAVVINVVVYYSHSKQLRNTTLLMYLAASILYIIQFYISYL